MTDVEDKKQWLMRYRHIREKINRLNNKINTIDDKITSVCTPNYSYMPKVKISNPKGIDDYLSDKIDIEERIKSLNAKAVNIKREIFNAIDDIEDAKQAEVLECYFIDCMTMPDIADTMGYTERYVRGMYAHAIHNIAIK